MDKNLENRIKALEKWQSERKTQQVTYPLDNQSIQILNKYFLSYVESVFYEGGVAGTLFKEILVRQNGRINVLGAETVLLQYTANTSTNYLTLSQDLVNLGQATLANNTNVLVVTSGVAPAPLSGTYFVVNAIAGDTQVQLSLTMGGVAVDITSTGTGNQYLIII